MNNILLAISIGLGIIFTNLLFGKKLITLKYNKKRKDLNVGDIIFRVYWDDNPYRRHIFVSIVIDKRGEYVKYMYSDGGISDGSISYIHEAWHKWEEFPKLEDNYLRLEGEEKYNNVLKLYNEKYDNN